MKDDPARRGEAHDIHNEACGCWQYPPPVTVSVTNDPARRGEAFIVKGSVSANLPCPICGVVNHLGGVDAPQPTAQEAERMTAKEIADGACCAGDFCDGHEADAKLIAAYAHESYRRGRAEGDEAHREARAMVVELVGREQDLRAENARLRKAWEQQGEAWKRDTRDAEKIKGQLSDKLAAAGRLHSQEVGALVAQRDAAWQREKECRDLLLRVLIAFNQKSEAEYLAARQAAHDYLNRAALAEDSK